MLGESKDYIGIKVRLEPNNKQASRMHRFAGAARFAYNWALETEKKHFEKTGKFIQYAELSRMFTRYKKEQSWLYEISNAVTKQAIIDAVNAFERFFKKQSNYPRFKSKKHSRVSFAQNAYHLKFTEDKVKLEKLTLTTRDNRGVLNWVRLSEENRIPLTGKCYDPRVTFDGEYWYISVCVEDFKNPITPNGEGIGIDLGIKKHAVCSDGTEYENIDKTETVRKIEKRKKRLQRQVSRKYEMNKSKKDEENQSKEKSKKTENIKKIEAKILKIDHRLKNIRTNHIHQMTSDIIKRNPSFIVLENLNVKGMMKNRHLSKAIQGQRFYETRMTLEYKAKRTNIPVFLVDRFFPSSKTCSECGCIKRDLKLSQRTFVCDECGHRMDRDLNAAKNLYQYGKEKYREFHGNLSLWSVKSNQNSQENVMSNKRPDEMGHVEVENKQKGRKHVF